MFQNGNRMIVRNIMYHTYFFVPSVDVWTKINVAGLDRIPITSCQIGRQIIISIEMPRQQLPGCWSLYFLISPVFHDLIICIVTSNVYLFLAKLSSCYDNLCLK